MKIIIFGSGGHAISCAAIAISLGYKISCLVDNDKNKINQVVDGIPILSEDQIKSKINSHFSFIAIGDNYKREQVFKKLKKIHDNINFINLIHPTAVVYGKILGKSNVIFPQTYLGPSSTVGNGVIINNSSSVDHECSLDDFSSVAPGAILGGNVRLGKRSALGIGAIIKHNISIGNDSVIGGNSFVNNNVSNNIVAYGTPIKEIRKRKNSDKYL